MVHDIDLKELWGLETTIEDIPVESLEIDPKIQRPEDRAKIVRIFRKFVPAGLGVISVSRRASGQIVVLDGQTRRAVVLKRGDAGPFTLRCEVYENLTTAQEALLFLTLNTGTKPNALATHHVSAAAGDQTVIGINEILAEYGYKVGTNITPGTISAVKSLARVYELSEKRHWDPNLLKLVLMVLSRAYGKDHSSTKGVVLEGLAALIDEYPTTLDIDRLTQRMRDYCSAGQLVSEAQALASSLGIRPSMAVAQVLVSKVYNKGGGRKLTAWRRSR